ncbi:hypothetical protein [Thiococcus pfennigii]|uniref:hypothetical protein n=1 Tax=Thiococcus pfennigii TaxID=1057 RepID=UPI0019069594|nr:hypothetical protein [Thiococcus pfennigii]
MKKRSMFPWIAVFSLAALPLCAQAIECDPEPTDMPVEYGDLITCQTDTTNDVDFFRFVGSVGDRIIIDVSNVEDVRPCILLTAPDGSTIDEKCQNVSGQIIRANAS